MYVSTAKDFGRFDSDSDRDAYLSYIGAIRETVGLFKDVISAKGQSVSGCGSFEFERFLDRCCAEVGAVASASTGVRGGEFRLEGMCDRKMDESDVASGARGGQSGARSVVGEEVGNDDRSAQGVQGVGECENELCSVVGSVGVGVRALGNSVSMGEVDVKVESDAAKCGKWSKLNRKKKERKRKRILQAGSWRVGDRFEESDVSERTDEQVARETLHKTWILKNELEAARLQREIEVAKFLDVEAEVKRRQSAVRKQTERNLAETEKHHRFLVRTGNVPGEGRPSDVKVVNGRKVREVVVDGEVKYEEEGVSGGGYVEGTVLESCTIQPSSSASMKEYMAEKKRAEDAEAKVKVLERQLASAGIGVKRDEVGNTEYSFSDGGDVTYRGKLQAAYRGKVVRVVKDSYGVPAVENVMAGAFGDESDTLSNVCIREVERYEEEVRRSKRL